MEAAASKTPESARSELREPLAFHGATLAVLEFLIETFGRKALPAAATTEPASHRAGVHRACAALAAIRRRRLIH
jgi:hypothetical protein